MINLQSETVLPHNVGFHRLDYPIVSDTFWIHLRNMKLDVFKLNQSSIPIHGSINPENNTIQLNDTSFDPIEYSEASLVVHGVLQFSETISSFKSTVKNATSHSSASESSLSANQPISFRLLCFPDLKKWKFVHWFSIPYFEVQVSVSSITAGQQVDVNNIPNVPMSPDHIMLYNSSNPFTWPINFRNLLHFTRSKKIDLYIKDSGLETPSWAKYSIELVYSDLDPTSTKLNNGWYPKRGGNPDIPQPSIVNLYKTFSKESIMEQNVNFNLQVMSWRTFPGFDLKKIQSQRVLLIGAGTLGCNVARNLLGWGFTHFTFVDNGRVSASNPVRQSLFSFADVPDVGKDGPYKAEAAAAALKAIYPKIHSTGVVMSIPMPGHHEMATPEEIGQQVNRLDTLVKQSTVVFLLLDSREARWLPTVICQNYNTPCISIGLGYNTYTVWRFGDNLNGNGLLSGNSPKTMGESNKLMCYFCQDQYAPGNSFLDRTMDQQCTATRTGVSFQGSAAGVELLVSMLFHPLHYSTPPPLENNESAGPLGTVPNQIQGNVANFSTSVRYGPSSATCTACSSPIISAYSKNPTEFVNKVIQDSSVLDDVSGQSNIAKSMEAMDFDDFAFSD